MLEGTIFKNPCFRRAVPRCTTRIAAPTEAEASYWSLAPDKQEQRQERRAESRPRGRAN